MMGNLLTIQFVTRCLFDKCKEKQVKIQKKTFERSHVENLKQREGHKLECQTTTKTTQNVAGLTTHRA